MQKHENSCRVKKAIILGASRFNLTLVLQIPCHLKPKQRQKAAYSCSLVSKTIRIFCDLSIQNLKRPLTLLASVHVKYLTHVKKMLKF